MRRLVEAEWRQTRSINEFRAYVQFLQKYPHIGRSRTERARWMVAYALGTAEAFQAFLESHPDGEFASQAHSRIRAIEAQRHEPRDWETAESVNTAASYEQFLKNHPRGKFAEQAEFRLAGIEDTPDAFESYLARYPRGSLAEEARKRLRVLYQQELKDITVAVGKVRPWDASDQSVPASGARWRMAHGSTGTITIPGSTGLA